MLTNAGAIGLYEYLEHEKFIEIFDSEVSPWNCPELEKYYNFNSKGEVCYKGSFTEEKTISDTIVGLLDGQLSGGPIFCTFTKNYGGYNYTRYWMYQVVRDSYGKYKTTSIGFRGNYKYYINGVESLKTTDYPNFIYLGSTLNAAKLNIDVPMFNTCEEGLNWVKSFFEGTESDAELVNNTYHISQKDIQKSNVLNKITAGTDGATLKQLQDVYNNVTNNTNNYKTVNEYVTDARQYINNYSYTTEEGDTVNNITNNNYNFDDSNIVNSLGGITGYLRGYEDYLGEILDSVKFQSKTIGDGVENLPAYLSEINTNVLALVSLFEHNFPSDVEIIIPDDNPSVNPDPFEWPEIEPFEWPEIEPFEWPEIEPFKWPEVDPFKWPEIDPFKWPEIEPFKWPEIDPFSWPDLPPFEWPDLPPFEWPDIVPDFDVIIPNVEPPDVPPWFPTIAFTDIVSKYSDVEYPVFSIETPTILQKFVKKPVIVLYDTKDHAYYFSIVRDVIKWVLYIGMVFWFLKQFKLHFTTEQGGI